MIKGVLTGSSCTSAPLTIAPRCKSPISEPVKHIDHRRGSLNQGISDSELRKVRSV